MPTKAQTEFVRKLKLVAKGTKHADLAEKMGIPLWKVRNWLYDNHPNEYAVKMLAPKLEKLL